MNLITMPISFNSCSPQKTDEIASTIATLSACRSKGELGECVAVAVLSYSRLDIQIISGLVNNEIHRLPEPYRKKVSQYLLDQLFGSYHTLLLLHHSGKFPAMTTPLRDQQLFLDFCAIIPSGCCEQGDDNWRTQYVLSPKHRLFYYLVSAFTMFVQDKPGHPVGMPFPGGHVVEERTDGYQCPIREKEKDIFFSICNFCPAKQMEGV